MAMPVKLGRNAAQGAEDAHRIAELRRENHDEADVSRLSEDGLRQARAEREEAQRGVEDAERHVRAMLSGMNARRPACPSAASGAPATRSSSASSSWTSPRGRSRTARTTGKTRTPPRSAPRAARPGRPSHPDPHGFLETRRRSAFSKAKRSSVL